MHTQHKQCFHMNRPLRRCSRMFDNSPTVGITAVLSKSNYPESLAQCTFMEINQIHKQKQFRVCFCFVLLLFLQQCQLSSEPAIVVSKGRVQ